VSYEVFNLWYELLLKPSVHIISAYFLNNDWKNNYITHDSSEKSSPPIRESKQTNHANIAPYSLKLCVCVLVLGVTNY